MDVSKKMLLSLLKYLGKEEIKRFGKGVDEALKAAESGRLFVNLRGSNVNLDLTFLQIALLRAISRRISGRKSGRP